MKIEKKMIVAFAISAIAGIVMCIVDNSDQVQYTEAGYLVKKTTDNCFHYEFNGDNACPAFEDNYYFTVFVDDNYVKFKVPLEVFEEHNLGDHITVVRDINIITKQCSDYNGVIYDIKIPAEISNY